ncbi:MAG: hypothetical protein AAF267_00400 [Deinococcota bacterium]
MTYILIAITNLVLTHLFNPVVTSSMTDGQAVQVEDVILAQDNGGLFPEHKDQGLIGAEGGIVYIENDDGEEIALVSLDPGFLKEQVLVTLQEEAYDPPPGRYDYLKMYEDEVVTQIGPRAKVTFPYSAINTESIAEMNLFIYPYEGMYDRTSQNEYEIQIAMGGEQVLFTRNLYSFDLTPEGPEGRAAFTWGSYHLTPPFADNPPETYEMIAQPISITRSPLD